MNELIDLGQKKMATVTMISDIGGEDSGALLCHMMSTVPQSR